MLDNPLQTVSLTNLAIHDLHSEFEGYGHNPSKDQWAAIEALLGTFDTIASGTAAPAIYLSSLDPGVGKTSAVIAYLRRLMQAPGHQNVGILLCLSRLDEIRRLTEALAGPGVTIAIRTGDEDLNSISNSEPDNAQLLVITQQRLELMSRGNRKIADTGSLFFKGAVRPLRIWDESFLPGRIVTPSSGDVAALLRELEDAKPEACAWMNDLFRRMNDADDGDIISVPMWTFADDGKHLSKAGGALKRRGVQGDLMAKKDTQTLEDLHALGGKAFSARQNGKRPSRSLAAYRKSLPEDLLPLVVLDASGRIRTTYQDLASIMALTRLPSAVKDYGSLTVNVWDRGGGKSGFDTDTQVSEIVNAISSLIQHDRYSGKWLIIVHKPSSKMQDIQMLVKANLAADIVTRLAFLTWGSHAAINDHADAERVILAGSLFFPPVAYEALKRLCLDKGPEERPLTKEELDATVIGESGHLVLQGLCRASVRKSINGAAGPCTAYLIASIKSGIRAKLPEWFPGCHVESWRPNGLSQLTGQAFKVFEYISQWVDTAGQSDIVRFAAIYRGLGIPEKVFRDVRHNKSFCAHLTYLGLEEVRGKKNNSSFGFIAED